MFIYYLQIAMKSLLKTKVTSALMVIAIACGIGISMTALTLNHMTDNNPIAHKNDQLFSLQLMTVDRAVDGWYADGRYPYQLTYQDATNIVRDNPKMTLAAMYKSGFAVRNETQTSKPFLKAARLTTRHFFTMFDMPFLYGSTWSEKADQDGANVVVISEEMNIKIFGGGDNTNKQIYLDNTLFTVVGITKSWNPAPKFYDVNNGPFQDIEQFFVPIALSPIMEIGSWGNNNGWKDEIVNNHQDKLQSEVMWLQFWAQLDSTEEKEAFEQYLAGYISEQKKLGRFNRDDAGAKLSNVQQWLDLNNVVGDDSNVLVGVSFMFLAVCLVNTIGLLLAKFLRSAPEVGVRRALGASKGQVFMQHLIEVGLLGFIGGLLGLVMANIGLYLLRSQFNGFNVVATMDMTMLFAAPIIAILATTIAGLYPAWRVCTTLPSVHLKTQ
ncbi:ABC transporter permease [Thalassotalea atypica]|uniref:ABC transporter permease n=1 Tax=Thalassotalea atypica TaxID=2054316 RepID=UPI0025730B79|nr:ABC transporter permease [Thalassotalea atypica]